MSGIFNLANSYQISVVEDSVSWITYEEFPVEGNLIWLGGRGWIENGVLILSTYKSTGPAEDHESIDGYLEKLSQLPKWNGTKYFADIDDFGHVCILHCESGDIATSDETDEVLAILEFLKKKN